MKKSVFLLLLISLISCQNEDDMFPDFRLEHADLFTADEYAVYAEVLENFSNAQLIIRQQTSAQTPAKENFDLFFGLEKMANMEATLYSKYEEENVSSSLLDDEIVVLTKDVKIISNNEYDYFFEREDINKAWSLFGNQYPNSSRWFFSLNKIGFNESKTQALVSVESYWYMESEDGPTLSSGTLIYLEKQNDAWERVGSTGYTLQ